MQLLWDNGPMYVRELVQLYPDPKPHVNTVSTVVRTLEEKGYVNHEAAGTGYKYFAVAQKEDFADKTLNNVIKGISTTAISMPCQLSSRQKKYL